MIPSCDPPSRGDAGPPEREKDLWLAGWSVGAILMGIVALASLVGPSCPGERAAPEELRRPLARHVVIVLLDTVRADRLQILGHDAETTPFLARERERLHVFTNAHSPAPWTLPACASLLTGLAPAQHGAGDLGDLADLSTRVPTALRDDVPTLASHLAAHGVRTEAWVTNPFLRFGVLRGFERATDLPGANALDVVARFEASLRGWDAGESHLAYLHVMDAHEPLHPAVEDLRALDRERPLPALPLTWLGMLGMRDEERKRRTWTWAYDAALRRIDRALERLFGALDATGFAHDTLVIVAADHGEALWDHVREERFWYDQGEFAGTGHGQSFFREQVHVPLFVATPDRRGAQHAELASLLDVAPTVLSALDLPAPAEAPWPGRPLLQTWAPGRRLVLEGLSRGRRKRATLDEDGTLFVEAGDALEPELLGRSAFDLAAPPLPEDAPERADRRRRLAEAPPGPVVDAVPPRLPSADQIREAAAFGYLLGVRPELVDRRSSWSAPDEGIRSAVIEERRRLDASGQAGGDPPWRFERTDPCFDGGVLHLDGQDERAVFGPPVRWRDRHVVLENPRTLVSFRPTAEGWERETIPHAIDEPMRRVRVAGDVLVVFGERNVHVHADPDAPSPPFASLPFAHGHDAVALRSEDGRTRLVLTARRDRPFLHRTDATWVVDFPTDHPLRLGLPLAGIVHFASQPPLPIPDTAGVPRLLPRAIDLADLPASLPPADAAPGFHLWRDRHVGRTLLALDPPPGLDPFPLRLELTLANGAAPTLPTAPRGPLAPWALLERTPRGAWHVVRVLDDPPLEPDALAEHPDLPQGFWAVGSVAAVRDEPLPLHAVAVAWGRDAPVIRERLVLPDPDPRRAVAVRAPAADTLELTVGGADGMERLVLRVGAH